MRQYSAPASPVRYDPVIIGTQNGNVPANAADQQQANLKEYETQVLAMAVPSDDHDDLQIDFSAKNHAFSLDNVSYITHKENINHNNNIINNGQQSPSTNSDSTAIVGTLQRNNLNNFNNLNHHHSNSIHNNNLNINNINNNRQNTLNRTLEMNRNNYQNPMGSTGTLPGTLTLGRIKSSDRNNIYNNYNG